MFPTALGPRFYKREGILLVGEVKARRGKNSPVIRVGKMSEAGKFTSLVNNSCSSERSTTHAKEQVLLEGGEPVVE